jgi:hypothetical protein
MAQYYADIQGNRGRATRMGTKSSGIDGHIRGWNIGVKVQCFYDEATDSDVCHVYQTGGSHGARSDKLIRTIREKRIRRRK